MAKAATKPAFSWANVSLEAKEKLIEVIGNDGHSIWFDWKLLEEGVDPAIVSAFARDWKSDFGSWKSTIYDANGNATNGMRASVYGLTVLRSLAGFYSIESRALGRGFEARELTSGIKAKLDEERNAQ